jgi:hypothetical protein
MSVFNQMKNIKDKVAFLLENKESLRDDDSKLIASFFINEIGRDKVDDMSAMDLLKLIGFGKLTSFESIRRVRAKLQENRPELRGKNYKERQDEGNDVKGKIKDL